MSTTTTIAPGGKSKRELVAELYNEHARELWATFYKGCNDAELANDVVHEAFGRFMEQANDSVRKPLSWLRRVGRNILIDRARRSRTIGPVQRLIDEIVFHSDEPWQRTRREERLCRLTVALSDLRDCDRQILQLRYWLDYSSIEIGEQLQIDPNAVDMRLTRARRRLAKQMSKNRADRVVQSRNVSETNREGESP
jgi:RNA polymerase sigma-70 factor (ECF subfamily)